MVEDEADLEDDDTGRLSDLIALAETGLDVYKEGEGRGHVLGRRPAEGGGSGAALWRGRPPESEREAAAAGCGRGEQLRRRR